MTDEVTPMLAHIHNFLLREADRPVAVIVVAEGCHIETVPLAVGIHEKVVQHELEVAVFQLCFSEEGMVFPRPLTQAVYHFEPGNFQPLAIRVGNEAVHSFVEDVERTRAVMAGATADEAFLSEEQRENAAQAELVFADEVEMPGAFQMGRNLAKQLFHTARAYRKGVPLFVTAEEYERRFSMCLECEHIRKASRCVKCGCRMNMKANLASAECPVGKW